MQTQNENYFFIIIKMIKISLFLTDVTDYPHFKLPSMVFGNDYRAKFFSYYMLNQ